MHTTKLIQLIYILFAQNIYLQLQLLKTRYKINDDDA